MLYGKPPSSLHLRVVGCFYFSTSLTQKDKFNLRVVRVILVSYNAHQKGYKLYKMENRTIFVSENVMFMETIFHSRVV